VQKAKVIKAQSHYTHINSKCIGVRINWKHKKRERKDEVIFQGPPQTRHLVDDNYLLLTTKAWFSYVRKIPDDQGFYFLPTIPDFADISDIHQRSVQDFPDYEFGGKWKVRQKSKLEHKCDRGTGAQQLRGLVMSEIHHQWTPMSMTVQI